MYINIKLCVTGTVFWGSVLYTFSDMNDVL